MTAATKDRDLQEVAPGRVRSFAMAAAAKVYAGTIAAIDASGNVNKGVTSAAIRAVGVFRKAFDNTGGAAGALSAEVERGVFGPFANSASGDLIAAADVGNDCYIVDDSTVAKTSNSSARSVAGKVWQVDASGVYVEFR